MFEENVDLDDTMGVFSFEPRVRLYRTDFWILSPPPPLPLINVQGRGKNVQETKGSPLLFKKNKKITIREGTISSETGI